MEHNHKTLWTLCILLSCQHALGGIDGPPENFTQENTPYSPSIKPEPISFYGNPKRYTVFKKTYHIRRNISEFKQTGVASWYGKLFHGNRTSSGELFNMHAISGAHKELPIPCYIQVTNLENNRKLIVRINDRGPFHTENRILDLSYAAAYKLGYAKKGIAKVSIKLISAPIERNQTIIELGTFKHSKIADKLAKIILEKLGHLPEYSTIIIGNQSLVKLYLGPYPNKYNLKPVYQALKKLDLDYKTKHI